MKTKLITDLCIEVLALSMIGEGIVGFIRPRRYSRFWKVGPKPLREVTEYLAEHRDLTRVLCVAEVGVGLLLALRKIDD